MRKLKFDLQVDPTALLAANPEAFYSAAYLTSDVPNNFRTLPGVKYQTKLGTVVFGTRFKARDVPLTSDPPPFFIIRFLPIGQLNII